jgi:hypothetical protein
MLTWQTAVVMFVGAIVLAVVFIVARGADSQTRWGFPAEDENDEKQLDWGVRSDFWLAEFDRAHAEQDLLGEELARESMAFLIDTEPQQVARPQLLLPTLPPPPPPPPPVSALNEKRMCFVCHRALQ